MLNHNIFIAQLLSSAMLVCLIWLIQILHYPSFYYIEESRFKAFSSFHQYRISFIVMPLMLIELGSGAFLLFQDDSPSVYLYNIIAILLIWLITFFVSIPCHMRLSRGKDRLLIAKLIKTNWIRTILWTVKTAILLHYFITNIH